MILPILLKPESDELIYGWYKRIEAACTFTEGAAEAEGFFKTFFPTGTGDGRTQSPRHDYILNLDDVCIRQSVYGGFPGVPDILKYHTDYYVMLAVRTYGEQVKLSEFILRPRTDRKTCIPTCRMAFSELHMREGDDHLHTEDQLPGVRVYDGRPLLCCEMKNGKTVPGGKLALKAGIVEEERLSAFTRSMYRKPAEGVSLEETKKALKAELIKKGFSDEYPYGGLPEALKEAGFAPFFRSDDIAVRVRKLMEQDSIIKEEMLSLLAFVFSSYDEFYDSVMSYRLPDPELPEGLKLLENHDPILKVRCLKCGDEFHIHKFGPVMGVGCPECDMSLSDDEIAMRYLSRLGDGHYEMLESFKGFGNRTKILHRTCGAVRNVNFSEMIWGRRICACETGVTEAEIQRRIDPTKTKFMLVSYDGRKDKGQLLRIKCLKCGEEFEITLRPFLAHPFCRKCRSSYRYRDAFEERVYDLGKREYRLLTPYDGEKTRVRILHERCGTVTEMIPYDFVAGRRCRLCCTGSRGSSGYSFRSDVYLMIKELSMLNGGICFREDLEKKLDIDSDKLTRTLQGLIKNGYVVRLMKETYSCEEHSPDEVAFYRYMSRNGKREGVYGYASAAYHEGITDEKPTEEYIFSNMVIREDAVRVVIGGKVFKVREPFFPVNNYNAAIHTALNLLMYAASDPDKADAVRTWIIEHGLKYEELQKFVGRYPSSAGRGLDMINMW